MKRVGVVGLAALCAVLLAGCFESGKVVTVNADGSGRMAVELVFQPFDLNLGGGAPPKPEEALKKGVRELIEKSEGIDTWSDISFRRTDDGRVSFKGTAYFKDLSLVKLHNMGFLTGRVTRDVSGNLVLEMLSEEAVEKPPKTPVTLTEEEMKAKVLEAKSSYQMMRPMLVGFFSTMKDEVRVILPGTVTEARNFTKEADGSLRIVLDGAKLLKVLDDSLKDDALLRKAIAGGATTDGAMPGDFVSEDIITEKLFGSPGSARAVAAAPLADRFDYAAEAAAAKAAFPGMIARLGLSVAPPVAVSPVPLAATGFRVAGVQIVRAVDTERDLGPFGASEPGYQLSLIGGLGQPVISAKEGRLLVAVADTGESLLPDTEFSRRIHFPRLGKDRASVGFDLALKLPGAGAKSLKEVSGTLECLTAKSEAARDLGFSRLERGAKGKLHGAEITEMEKEEGGESLELEIALAREMIKEVKFLTAAGAEVPVARSGWSSFGDSSSLQFTAKAPFARDGKVVVTVYTDVTSATVPFKIENVSLLGAPLP